MFRSHLAGLATFLIAAAASSPTRADDSVAAHVLKLDSRDYDEITEIEEYHREMGGQLRQVAASLEQGDLDRAFTTVAEINADDAMLPLLSRLRCALAIERNDDDADERCLHAAGLRANPTAVYGWVSTLDADATEKTRARALKFTRRALEADPSHPGAHAASCHLAITMNDETRFHHALARLESLPNDEGHGERCAAAAPASWRSRESWARLIWGAIAVYLGAFVVHAVWRRRRAAVTNARPATAALTVALGLLLASPSARASDASTTASAPSEGPAPTDDGTQADAHNWEIDDANPSASLPPSEVAIANLPQFANLLMELSSRANASLEEQDGPRAQRYFDALIAARPQRAVGHRGRCAALRLQAKPEAAIESCHTAIASEGAELDDYAALLELYKAVEYRESYAEDARDVIDHVIAERPQDLLGHLANCDLAVTTDDRATLEACSTQLAALAPDDHRTTVFRWAAAAARRDVDECDRLIAVAQETGVPEDGIREMQAQLAALQPWWHRGGWYFAGGLVLLGIGLLRGARSRLPAPSSSRA
ncbi:MAG: hypothetical protein B7733_25075 [Myxococcales bacterium FL481]|nr:MAG: hypothetical protein B7733_25075 [Myxococcales bacterium FL481]